MVAYRIIFLAGAVAALPLNINLGAYSPALVVGKRCAPPSGPAMTTRFADNDVRQQVMVKLALEVIKMCPGS